MHIAPMRVHVQPASYSGHHEQYSPFQSAMCKRWDTLKKIVGPDRHQQRKREDLEASLETAQQRVANKVEALQEQQAKVAESKAKGHGKRLEQRQQALLRVAQELEEAQHQQGKWVAQVEA